MDRQETLNTFHWHRWVASRKGSVTISAEDMDLYCVLINNLISENEKLKAQRYMAHSDGRIDMIPTVESVRADTVRKMQKALEQRIHSKLSYHGWYLKETVIDQIANEMLEGVPEVK